jgi:DNA-binding protein H-NS
MQSKTFNRSLIMNLSNMPLSALQKIEKELPEAIRQAKAREIERAREAVSRALKDTGFTLADLTGKASKLKGSTIAPKYSNGNGKTWTGRGRAPKWMGKNKDKWEGMLI